MAFRLDIGTLGKAVRTPQGGLKVPAYLTRSGVFDYHTADGKVIKEYRPPEEVFKADALCTLPDAPVTNDHPPEHVYPDNFKKYSVGHVAGEAKQDGDKVCAPIVVQDAGAIKAINKGRQEISCGYHCDVDETPGVSPEGLPYDRIQRNIKYNHVALVDNGRAGSEIRLRLDSSGNSIPKEEKSMEYEIIGGVKYEAGSEPHADATKRRDAADKKALSENAALKARADAAEQKLAQATKALKDAYSPERFDRAVKVRHVVVTKSLAILGKNFKTDGLSNLQIKAAVVAKAFPALRLDSLDKRMANPAERRAYINGLFRAVVSSPSKRSDSAPVRSTPPAHLLTAPPTLREDVSALTMEDVRRKRNDDLEERHKKPLMVSKSNPVKPLDGFPALQGSMLETMK